MTPKEHAEVLAHEMALDVTDDVHAHLAVAKVASALLEAGLKDRPRAFELAFDAVMTPYRAFHSDLALARARP